MGFEIVEPDKAFQWSRSRKGGRAIAQSPILGTTITVDRLKMRGCVPLLDLYNQVKPYTTLFPVVLRTAVYVPEQKRKEGA
ncbi:hypothetical protein OU798_20815 [Prolixibacteraceae bacterium Z1-6]|uniref:Uncharacterized protein n=1 Tax=Draconibacterium aestuarii TaxID=2998507 RepID=A0A9X3J887_9BACT|nr:hypothetical protein [Prolixibacteraceae bacterium Z1-6]